MENLESRIDRLERTDHRLARAGKAATLVAAAVVLMGQTGVAPSGVAARSFELVDAAGKIRARLYTEDAESVLLALHDSDQAVSATLRLTGQPPSLRLIDASDAGEVCEASQDSLDTARPIDIVVEKKPPAPQWPSWASPKQSAADEDDFADWDE